MWYVGAILNDKRIYVHFQGKPFDITFIKIYAQTTDAIEAEVDQFCEDLQDKTNTKRRCPFHGRGLEWESRKSRDSWSIRKVWPFRIQNETGKRLTEF